jgi:hypothetical protein
VSVVESLAYSTGERFHQHEHSSLDTRHCSRSPACATASWSNSRRGGDCATRRHDELVIVHFLFQNGIGQNLTASAILAIPTILIGWHKVVKPLHEHLRKVHDAIRDSETKRRETVENSGPTNRDSSGIKRD